MGELQKPKDSMKAISSLVMSTALMAFAALAQNNMGGAQPEGHQENKPEVSVAKERATAEQP
jgi:hypothetical protein